MTSKTHAVTTAKPTEESLLFIASLLDAPPEALLSAEQAALFLGLRPATLAIWRSSGRYDLPYLKVGRLVRYRLGDLQLWLQGRSRLHTGE